MDAFDFPKVYASYSHFIHHPCEDELTYYIYTEYIPEGIKLDDLIEAAKKMH